MVVGGGRTRNGQVGRASSAAKPESHGRAEVQSRVDVGFARLFRLHGAAVRTSNIDHRLRRANVNSARGGGVVTIMPDIASRPESDELFHQSAALFDTG